MSVALAKPWHGVTRMQNSLFVNAAYAKLAAQLGKQLGRHWPQPTLLAQHDLQMNALSATT